MVSIKWEHQLYFDNTFYTNKKGKQKKILDLNLKYNNLFVK